MFFILSKVLNFLTNPLVIVLAFIAYGFLTRNTKRKKISFWIAFSLSIFFSNDFIANEVMSAWEVSATPYADIKKSYEWGIVLTGVTANDKMPDDRVYFIHGADRVVHAVELYKKGIIKRIMISGGSGRLLEKARNESEEVLKVMLLMGVPRESISLETESRNTHESAVNVKKILAEEQGGSCLLITSAFHMRRSIACFRKVGFNWDVFSCDFYTHPRSFAPDSLIVPKPDAIMIWQKLFKEWTGMVAYKVAGYI